MSKVVTVHGHTLELDGDWYRIYKPSITLEWQLKRSY